MLAFPSMIARSAEEAGMKVPDFDAKGNDEYDAKDYSHFHVFCVMQLGQPLLDWGSHWTNAKIIAAIPDNKIKTVTAKDIEKLGFHL